MNRMLILYIFLLLCGTVSAQRTVEWNDLQPLTDDAHRTVYYKKDSKRPLQGKYRLSSTYKCNFLGADNKQ